MVNRAVQDGGVHRSVHSGVRGRRSAWLRAARERRRAGHRLLGVAAGSGLIADAALEAGADVLLAYNSSRFRCEGHGSLASMLPFGSANEIVLDLGRRILATRPGIPLVAGVCATDPLWDVERLLDAVEDLGFLGVQTFPTVTIIDGAFRDDLEATGLGFDTEVELLRAARRRGFLTSGYVASEEEAIRMALLGVDVIAVHLGVTRNDLGPRASIDAGARVSAVAAAVRAVRDDVLVMFHGGPVHRASDLDAVLAASDGVDGYLAASAVERTYVAEAVRAGTRDFLGSPTSTDGAPTGCAPVDDAARVFAGDAPPPEVELDVDNTAAYLRGNGLIGPDEAVEISPLGGGVSNAILRYDTATGSGVLKQARGRVRVQEEWLCDLRRIVNEHEAITAVAPSLPPGTVPAIRHVDDANYVFTMDCAPKDAHVWKEDLLQGHVDGCVAATAAAVLADIHDSTRDNPQLRRRFANDSLLTQLRADPWYTFTAAKHPSLAPAIAEGARRLLEVREVLVHGDYVPKNILVSKSGLMVVDWEVAHFGNAGYDVAQMITHLVLKAMRSSDDGPRLLDAALRFWSAYQERVGKRRAAAVEDEALLQLGCLLLARVDGKSPVDYLPDTGDRDRVRALATRILRNRPARLGDIWAVVETHVTERRA